MGLVLLRLGRLAEAETALAASAKGFEDLSHATARANVDIVRADLLARHERFDEAQRLAQAALATLAARPADSVAARHLMARLALAAGDETLAENELNTAVGLARNLDLPPLLAELLHTRGRVHRRAGRLGPAIDDLVSAVDTVERVRGTLQADRFRAAYLGGRCDLYEDLVDAALDAGDAPSVARAFEATEMAKSRTLLDQIGAVLEPDGPGAAESHDPTADALLDRLGRIQSRLNGLYCRLAETHATDRPRDAGRELNAEIRRREQELDALRSRLSITSGRAGLLAPMATLGHVQGLLAPRTLLLEYMSVGDEIVLFAIDADRVTVRRGIGRVSQAAARLSRLRFQFDRALRPGATASRRFARMIDDTREELGALHRLLLGPIEDRLAEADALTIVPHGPLHLVPFHALHDGAGYLLDTHSIQYVPSASILAQLAATARTPRRDGPPLVVGVSDEIAPQIADEAKAVAAALGCDPSRVLLDDAATVDAVTRASGAAGLLHLACHGRFTPESPLSSGLRLADRWLTVRDIYDLRLDADLVTLSGCETGVNTITAGDELMGLLRGFFAAGARSVLASLWRADDDSTARFMCRYYDRLAEGPPGPGDKARALRAIQREMSRELPHAAYWAPFILVGQS
jgi:CHAT domain-containing protein